MEDVTGELDAADDGIEDEWPAVDSEAPFCPPQEIDIILSGGLPTLGNCGRRDAAGTVDGEYTNLETVTSVATRHVIRPLRNQRQSSAHPSMAITRSSRWSGVPRHAGGLLRHPSNRRFARSLS